MRLGDIIEGGIVDLRRSETAVAAALDLHAVKVAEIVGVELVFLYLMEMTAVAFHLVGGLFRHLVELEVDELLEIGVLRPAPAVEDDQHHADDDEYDAHAHQLEHIEYQVEKEQHDADSQSPEADIAEDIADIVKIFARCLEIQFDYLVK